MDYKVIFTQPAEEDLSGIVEYITCQFGSPTVAHNMILTIRKQIRSLAYMPSGPKVRNKRLAAQGYRWLRVKNYMVFYTIYEQRKTVYIERILHSRRNWQAIL
ncbi:MAG: type II toxin-antitoxin system RelE/ParE family toxin [Oscillospiraceae bacterium]|nr:type II toxin-antitoxin system RelE/ParE family toxin [Oscillospiraceae bacterium]